MQRLTKILSILSVIPSVTLLLTGCSSTDESLYYPAEESSLHLRLSNTDIVIDAVDGKATIQIESNATWSVEDPQNVVSWISFPDGSSGKGNGQLEISCQNNGSPNSRSTEIIIVGVGKKESVTITQSAMTVTVSDNELSLTNDGAEVVFTLRCPTAWKIESNRDWLTVNPSEGIGDGTLQKIFIKATSINTSTSERTGALTISFPNSSFEDINIAVSQAASPIPQLSVPEVINRTMTSVKISGTYSCAEAVVDCGVFFHTISNFNELTGTKVADATPADGIIEVDIFEISQGIEYYARTYATTVNGITVLSDPVQFSTLGKRPDESDNILPN